MILSRQRNGAMTAFEVLVVVCLLFLAALLLTRSADQNKWQNRARRINCVSNLRQVNIAFRIWAGDNNNQFPMAVSVTNGGGREFFESGNIGALLQLTSNEMSTTKIFVCPADQNRNYATNWNDLDRSHISFFFGADATNDSNPNFFLDGDDNLIVASLPVNSGVSELSSNTVVTWSEMRHMHVGNVGFGDGSVMMEPPNGLQQAFERTGLATNRIVIP
jgi:hypothetical protein